MNTDGNTDAINRYLAEREAYDEQRDAETELQDLRDEVDALAAKLAEAEAERDRLAQEVEHGNTRSELDQQGWAMEIARAEATEAMLPRAYRAGVEDAAMIGVDWANGELGDKGIWEAIRAQPVPTSAKLLAQLKETE